MAARTTDVELTILGRRFSMACPRDMADSMTQAAETLDADLKASLGADDASNLEMIDNLVALALEYLCRDLDEESTQEQAVFARQIEAATAKLSKAADALPSA